MICRLATTRPPRTTNQFRPRGAVPTADTKRRITTAARCALAGATLNTTDDDRGRVLFVVTLGAATHHFRSLDHVDAWLDALSEVTHGVEV